MRYRSRSVTDACLAIRNRGSGVARGSSDVFEAEHGATEIHGLDVERVAIDLQ